MPSFSLQLTNARHDTLVLHRVLPLRPPLITEGTIVWVPVHALLHRDHRTQEPLVVYVPFDRAAGQVVLQREDGRRETIRVRLAHPGGRSLMSDHVDTDAPGALWTVAHLSLTETTDFKRMQRAMGRYARFGRIAQRLRGLTP